jgi:AraC family transcriptional regulator of adaptative response/methylated-DNA-[protein]-cysteine methyltransferase
MLMRTMPDPAERPDDDTAWAAVLRRDRAYDGRFVTGVLSTGIYCRPSCAARHPARGNVRFFGSGAEAAGAGLRACLRCRPDEVARDETAVARAVALLRASAEGAPSLAELAAEVGYSPAHFQRVFTRAVGLSPATYARALRKERAGEALSGGGRVSDAVYSAGYSGPSRFYAEAGEALGMAPSAWRDGGRGVNIRWDIAPTSLGPLLVAVTDKGVCRVTFGESGEDLARRFPAARLERGGFAQLLAEVVAGVERPGSGAVVPLDVRGTAFQERVWQALRAIPAGETRTDAQIAAAAGNPGAVRAAGSANGANPVAVLVPCHRVVRSDGTLGGYAWGEGIKRELLRREREG